MKRILQSGLSVIEDAIFDFRHKLNTSSVVSVAELDISEADKKHAVRYKPTRVRYFRKFLQAVPLSHENIFVDVGCGKGRVLLLAATYGFKRCLGLELSESLTRVAVENVKTFRRKNPGICEIDVKHANVLDYSFAGDESVFFLYWPFDRVITVKFLSMLRKSLQQSPRELWLVINEFQFSDLLENDPDFKLVNQVNYGASSFSVYHVPALGAP